MNPRTSLPRAVARQIEEIAVSRDVGSNGPLPSERKLSAMFGVSRTSVREALSILEASGKLRTEPGRGSFWARADGGDYISTAEEFPTAPDPRPFAPLDLGSYPTSELSRFRYLIEGQAGRLAAMRISDDQIHELEDNLSRFKSQIRSAHLEESAITDFEFHHLVVQYSGVQLFEDLHIQLRDVLMPAIRMFRTQYKRAWEPVPEHERILEALRRRDPDETLYYMQSHIVRSAERLGIINAKEIF